MNSLKVGPLEITFHRTVRVRPDQTSNLPPSLGYFPVYKVSDYRANTPAHWEDDAVFIALHDKEAMWMSFGRHGTPVAVMVGCGGINALDGEKLGTKLAKDNYFVTPPQPWLDGWKDQDGTVFQFVTTEYQKGEGNTVAEQLIGAESKTGAIGIAVFEAINPDRFPAVPKPSEVWGDKAAGKLLSDDSLELTGDKNYCGMGFAGESSYLCSSGPSGQHVNSVRTRGGSAKEMGVGKGGKITQKIYPDPHGIEAWKETPAAAVALYLVDSKTFSEITGLPMPPLPKAAEEYYGKWFGLKDEDKGDVQGTGKFTGLKNAFAGDTENVVQGEQPKSPVDAAK